MAKRPICSRVSGRLLLIALMPTKSGTAVSSWSKLTAKFGPVGGGKGW